MQSPDETTMYSTNLAEIRGRRGLLTYHTLGCRCELLNTVASKVTHTDDDINLWQSSRQDMMDDIRHQALSEPKIARE